MKIERIRRGHVDARRRRPLFGGGNREHGGEARVLAGDPPPVAREVARMRGRVEEERLDAPRRLPPSLEAEEGRSSVRGGVPRRRA